MKKIVTVFAFALLCSGAYAQFNQGRILAGGSVGFTTYTRKAEFNNTTNTVGKGSSFTINPKVGYFVIDQLAVGVGLSATGESFKPEGSSGKNSSSTVTFGPFVRYYIQPGLFFQAQTAFGGYTDKSSTGNTTTTTKYGAFTWDIGVGYAYFLNDYVAIEPIIMYGMQSYKNKDNDAKQTDGGLGVQIGLQVYLGARN